MIPIPLFDKVLVKPLLSEQSIGGLIIPDTSTTLKKGLVISAGNGTPTEPMTVVVGTTVFYREEGVPFNYEGEQYLVFNERQLLLTQ